MGAWRCAAAGSLCLLRRLRGVRAIPRGTKCGPCPRDNPDVDMCGGGGGGGGEGHATLSHARTVVSGQKH